MAGAVAMIMRARNEMPHVQRALQALAGQQHSTYELFAVDSSSTDGTQEALRDAGADVQVILPEDYVPGRVLNRAIRQTQHEIIVLLNADAIPLSDDWLEQLLTPLRKNEAEAVFSRQVARPDARFIVAYDYSRAFNPALVEPAFFSAVACAFKRTLWEQHPFRETGYAEDAAWAKACVTDGARIRLVPEAVVEHSHNYTLAELYTKRRRQAATFPGQARALRQAARCLREMLRDLFHAVRTFHLLTIPYNILYRITIHCAVYRGMKAR